MAAATAAATKETQVCCKNFIISALRSLSVNGLKLDMSRKRYVMAHEQTEFISREERRRYGISQIILFNWVLATPCAPLTCWSQRIFGFLLEVATTGPIAVKKQQKTPWILSKNNAPHNCRCFCRENVHQRGRVVWFWSRVLVGRVVRIIIMFIL